MSASHNGTSTNVDLFLADAISAQGWSLTVTGVRDLDGNPIVLPQTVEVSPPPPASAGLDGPPRTFLPREGEEYPVTMSVGAGLLLAVQGVGLRAPLSIPDATVAVVGPSPLPFTEATLSLEPR